MRMIKRIVKRSLTLVMVILLSCASKGGSLQAASPELPASDQKGNLTIHKFQVEDYENLKESTGSSSDAENLPGNAQSLKGVTFTLEKLTVVPGEDPQITDPKDPVFSAVSKETDINGEICFTDLEKGFYLVTERIPEGYTAQTEQFIVKIPMDESDSQGNTVWNYDVHVYPKSVFSSGEEGIEMWIGDARIVVGVDDIIPWVTDYPLGEDLKVEAMSRSNGGLVNYASNFYIYDLMDSRLAYEGVRFELLNGEYQVISGITLTEGVDYREDADSQADTVFWRFEDEGIRKAADNQAQYIRAYVETRVRPEAAGTSVKAMWNNAGIEFINGYGDFYKHMVFDPEVEGYDGNHVPRAYLGHIRIDKIEKDRTEIKLAGAAFRLAASEADAKAENFLSRVNPGGTEEEIVVITDNTGAAEIDAVGAGTYYLVEMEAPKGYKLNQTPLAVTVKNQIDERFTNLQVSNDPEAGSTGGSKGSSASAGSVRTGDVARIGGFLLMVAGAVGIIVYLVKKSRKDSKQLSS